MMAIQNEREWARFCDRFLGRPELAAHPDYAGNAARDAHREALGALIAARFAELTAAEAIALLAAVPVAYARVNTMAEVWAHPQLAARGRWHEVDTPAGPVPALAPPGLVDAAPRMDAVPALGRAHPADPRRAGAHRRRDRRAGRGGRREDMTVVTDMTFTGSPHRSPDTSTARP